MPGAYTSPNIESASAAFHAGLSGTNDARAGVMALLRAARACDWMLADEMDEHDVSVVLACIDAASEVLMRTGAALDLGTCTGTA